MMMQTVKRTDKNSFSVVAYTTRLAKDNTIKRDEHAAFNGATYDMALDILTLNGVKRSEAIYGLNEISYTEDNVAHYGVHGTFVFSSKEEV
jgi:hypothetical protein